MNRLGCLFALPTLLAAWQPPAGAIGPGGQAPLRTDCAVDGYVVNAVTGEPVPRANTVLSGASGQSSIAADSSGHWSFFNVACGQIQITVSRPGFLNGNLGQPHISGTPYSPVVLTSGSPTRDIRIQLIPTSAIVGKVVDDQGDPIMNAQVTLRTSRVVDGRRILAVTGNSGTNDLGEFRLSGLNAGKYIICARWNERGGSNSMTLGESCYPGPADGGAGGAVSLMDLAAGRETRVDFTLRTVQTVHVRGVISGMPKTQGVALTLVRQGVGDPASARPARIGADGKFDVPGVPPGSYILSTDYFEGGIRLMARVPVETGNSDVDDVAVHLDSGFTMTGKVRIESTSGTALTRQFPVSLRSAEPNSGGAPTQWSADHSTFTIADLMPGNYRLAASPPGQLFVKSATLAGRDILAAEVPITQAAGLIEIVLSDDGGAIDAQVTGADDQPVPSSWVMVLRDGWPPRNGMTGADGHARLQGLAPGDYRVYAWDDVQQVEYANPDWMQRYGVSGVSVGIYAGQTAQVTLRQQRVPAQ